MPLSNSTSNNEKLLYESNEYVETDLTAVILYFARYFMSLGVYIRWDWLIYSEENLL